MIPANRIAVSRAVPDKSPIKGVHQELNLTAIRYQVVTKVCYPSAMVMGNLTLKSEPNAFRGIVIGLLLSLPMWLAIATISWNFLSLQQESEQPTLAVNDTLPGISGPIASRQIAADNGAQ